MGTRTNHLAVWLGENSEDCEFDLPSPTLISRSGVSTPDLFTCLPQASDNPHYRDPSFSVEYSDLYDIQAAPPTRPKQHHESPKFSGSSVFDSRVITPVVAISPGNKQTGGMLRRRRLIQAVTPVRRADKEVRILPNIGLMRKERLQVAGNRKNEAISMIKVATPVKKVPKLGLFLPGGDTESISDRHWVKMSPLRSELSKLLGYSPKPQSSRPHLTPVTPRPPSAPKGSKSPLTVRYTARGLKG